MPLPILEVIGDKRIVVVAGHGGVGKTSVAASLGVLAANAGKRALILTIDPSRRLAQTLQIDRTTTSPKMIRDEAWRLPRSNNAKGALFGMVLDAKEAFDDVIRRFAKSPEAAEQILRNPIYVHLSSILAGSQEYMAMEAIHRLRHDPLSRFDLLILDTPPSSHALDFLDAPQKMVRAIGDSVLKYFLRPGLFIGRRGFQLAKLGPKRFFHFLDEITGVQLLEEVSELLILIESLLGGFSDRAKSVEALLKSKETAFIAVSSLSPWAAQSALSFCTSLMEKSVTLSGLVLNRTIPDFSWDLSAAESRALPKETVEFGKSAYSLYDALWNRERKEEAALRRDLAPSLAIWKLPLFSEEVHDFETLKLMARELS